jgi:hypothetical protein
MKTDFDYKEPRGSRPPPSKRPRTQAISIFMVMGLVIAGAFVASGGGTPVDPNGPGGPPTLEPHFNIEDYPRQRVVLPSDPQSQADTNLQLKTFNVNNCGKNSAMIFLIDTSGSMKFANKIGATKTALNYFLDNLGGKSVVGLYSFSKDVKELVPINYYKDSKPELDKAINGLKPDGHTRTRDGMALVKEKMKEVIEEKAYPGYKYSLIIMTDGVPEIPPDKPRNCYVTAYDPNTAPALRCFAREQDPRVPTNLANEIKMMGVGIYSVNIYSPNYPSDVVMFPYLEALLKEISSPPVESHYFSSVNGANLEKILESVVASICADEGYSPGKPLN